APLLACRGAYRLEPPMRRHHAPGTIGIGNVELAQEAARRLDRTRRVQEIPARRVFLDLRGKSVWRVLPRCRPGEALERSGRSVIDDDDFVGRVAVPVLDAPLIVRRCALRPGSFHKVVVALDDELWGFAGGQDPVQEPRPPLEVVR